MSDRLLARDVHCVRLDGPVAAGTEIVEGDPVAAYATLVESDKGAEVGLWEMTAGSARDVEHDEVFLVLSGRATLGFADGETVELHPGALVRLRAGEHTEWHVHETLRKLYIST